MKRSTFVAAVAAGVSWAVRAQAARAAGDDVFDVILNGRDFSTLTAAFRAAGMVGELAEPGPYTIFAPTDAAFSRIPQPVLDALLTDPAKKSQLRSLLRYHVVRGDVTSATLQPGQYRTLQGQSVAISRKNGVVLFNDAIVTMADLKATNGSVQIVDVLLFPPQRS